MAVLVGGGKMAKQTEPKTPMQIISYVVSAIIAIWLIIWMLQILGINLL
jgi:hypothetical protein